MTILKANPAMLATVKQIVHETISAIYPHYYPRGAVDFFLAHHSDDRIADDIRAGIVYLLSEGDAAVGTVTIRGNELCRLFVLPQHQHKGFGRHLLDFAEAKIFEDYEEICLDSSLPAKHTYLKRGYAAVDSHRIVVENGDVLCYDWMKKSKTCSG